MAYTTAKGTEMAKKMFYAIANKAIVGSNWYAIAFESKKKRDDFCRHTEFVPCNAKNARKLPQIRMIRTYTETIFNENNMMQGVAIFTVTGEFLHIT